VQTLGNQSPVNWNRLWIAIGTDWIWLLRTSPRAIGPKVQQLFGWQSRFQVALTSSICKRLSYRKTGCHESQSPNDEINQFWAGSISFFCLACSIEVSGVVKPVQLAFGNNYNALGVLLCKQNTSEINRRPWDSKNIQVLVPKNYTYIARDVTAARGAPKRTELKQRSSGLKWMLLLLVLSVHYIMGYIKH